MEEEKEERKEKKGCSKIRNLQNRCVTEDRRCKFTRLQNMTPSAPEHFNTIAGQYAASEVHANSPTIRRLHELLASKQLDSVCDIACGPGHLALSFAGKASHIVGVDAAPNMLRQFERLAKERGVKVETVHAYAESVPLPANSFDVVVSRLAPHHFPDVAKAIREMARLTKPGGGVAVIDLEGNENPALDDLNHQNRSAARSVSCPKLHRCALAGFF